MTTVDPQVFADRLSLRYVNDEHPGISRRRRGRGWSFHGPDGATLQGDARDRCLRLAIPPAWLDVWICADDDGHLQARGTDEATRRQYRYHDRWTEGRRLANFDRLQGMAGRLGPLRQALDALLEDGTDEGRRATAAMVRLVDAGLARIGGARSAREMGHYGVSTLQREHVAIDDTTVVLDYPAKHGKPRHIEVSDPLLAEVLAQLELGGGGLFQVRSLAGSHDLEAADANALLAELTGGWMTCKDFRTWGGTAVALQARVEGATPVQAVDAAAEALGNTRAVARSAYLHPVVLQEDDRPLRAAWSASRSSTRFDRRESALAKVLEAAPPLLDGWLRT